jgi:hypothetical protein
MRLNRRTFIALAAAGAAFPAPLWAQAAGPAGSLLAALDSRRAVLGLTPVSGDPGLNQLAERQVVQMAAAAGPVSLDGEWLQQVAGGTGFARLYQFGSAGFAEPQRVIEDWSLRQGLDAVLRETQTLSAGAGYAQRPGLHGDIIPVWLLLLGVPPIR